MKKLLIALIVLVLLLVLVWQVLRHLMSPVDVVNSADIFITIPPNSSTGQIAEILEESSVIRNATVFAWYARLQKLDSSMKPGVYLLNNGMSLSQVAKALSEGKTEKIIVTIPEGYTIAQITDLLVQRSDVQREDFTDALDNPWQFAFLAEAPVSQWGLEGYLFPDTYYFDASVSAHDAVEIMLSNFQGVINEHDYLAQVEAQGLTLHQALTIASMIEREAMVAEERPKIAGVIFNRLEIGMQLQIDATVQYALGENKEILLYRDLEIDSPYNTYRINGLPPGPIANPGWSSMEAVVHPETHDYLYYVAKPDGSHAFSKTYAEHNANIRKYQ